MHAADFLPMSAEEALFARSALGIMGARGGKMNEEELALMSVAAEIFGGPLDRAGGISTRPEEAASVFVSEGSRRRFIQLLMLVGMIGGDFNADRIEIVKSFATALAVDGVFVDRARRIIAGHLQLARLDAGRRVPPVKLAATDTWGEAALSSSWDLLRGSAMAFPDPEVAWRHKRLGLLQRGTLGREYWIYMTSKRFYLPGEGGASFAGTTLHDFVHALCGYDTDPAGEAEISAFTAGLLRLDDPLAMILGSMSMMLLGSKIMQAPNPFVLDLDYARVGRALRRGLRATPELAERWDPWAVVGEPVAALLDRYGVQPE